MVAALKLFLVGALLRHVNRDADRPHDGPVQIVQRGFIGCQQPGALAGLDGFFRNEGFLRLHHNPFGLDTSGIVLLHIPNIGMAAPLYLFFCFIDGLAETVVYLLVATGFILIPNQVGYAVDGRL